mmetsp:Transcript_26803/g.76900  ORF Transcript_26803/g.76900 Transcript_26803/m.76900 type:complete len:254 (+) Transcript_26803:3055-3816(+)
MTHSVDELVVGLEHHLVVEVDPCPLDHVASATRQPHLAVHAAVQVPGPEEEPLLRVAAELVRQLVVVVRLEQVAVELHVCRLEGRGVVGQLLKGTLDRRHAPEDGREFLGVLALLARKEDLPLVALVQHHLCQLHIASGTMQHRTNPTRNSVVEDHAKVLACLGLDGHLDAIDLGALHARLPLHAHDQRLPPGVLLVRRTHQPRQGIPEGPRHVHVAVGDDGTPPVEVGELGGQGGVRHTVGASCRHPEDGHL